MKRLAMSPSSFKPHHSYDVDDCSRQCYQRHNQEENTHDARPFT